MSGMKNLLGERDFEEIEKSGSVMLEDIMQEDVNRARELCGDDFEERYNNWLFTDGQVVVKKWLSDNSGKMIGWDGVSGFAQHLMKRFIEYLEA